MRKSLVDAVESGDLSEISRVLKGVASSALNVSGEPLVYRLRSTIVISLLVKAGAPIDQLSLAGQTLLEHLLWLSDERRFSRLALIQLVGPRVKNIDQSNADDLTPLYIACGLLDFSAVKLLCDLGADVNRRCGAAGQSPFSRAVSSPTQSSRQVEIVGYLIANGAEIDCFEKKLGWTPLMAAVFLNDLSVVKVLITGGADHKLVSLGLNDYPKETAIEIARRMRYENMVAYLENDVRR